MTRSWNLKLHKNSHSTFNLKSDVYKIAQNSRNVRATFDRKCVVESFQNRPIWSNRKKVTHYKICLAIGLMWLLFIIFIISTTKEVYDKNEVLILPKVI